MVPVTFRPDTDSELRETEGRLSNDPSTIGYYWLDDRRIEHGAILELLWSDNQWYPVMATHLRYVYGAILEFEFLPTDDDDGGDTVCYQESMAESLRWPTEVPACWLRVTENGGLWRQARDGGWHAELVGVSVVVDQAGSGYQYVVGLGPAAVKGHATTLEQARRDALWAAMHWQDQGED